MDRNAYYMYIIRSSSRRRWVSLDERRKVLTKYRRVISCTTTDTRRSGVLLPHERARTTKRRRIGVPNKTGVRVPAHSRRAYGSCPRGRGMFTRCSRRSTNGGIPLLPSSIGASFLFVRGPLRQNPPPHFLLTPQRAVLVCDIIILLYTLLFILYYSHTRKRVRSVRLFFILNNNM